MQLLLISNSTNAGEGYLDYCKQNVVDFMLNNGARKALFFPFAAVTFSYDEYEQKVSAKLAPLGLSIESVHRAADARQAVRSAQAIIVGGGNTFHLLAQIQRLGLIDEVRAKVMQGTPYAGWSAGSNMACPTICTTNDMPIVEPKTFEAFNLVPFQINPHYLDAHPSGHAGETREQRIEEYIAANPHRYVAGLREASMLYLDNDRLRLHGARPMRIFKHGIAPREVNAGDDLQFLIENA